MEFIKWLVEKAPKENFIIQKMVQQQAAFIFKTERSWTCSRNKICCDGKLWKLSAGTDCCGTNPFFPRKQLCCGSKILSKKKNGCCGISAFLKTKSFCCGNELRSRKDELTRCCGKNMKTYDPRQGERCCGNGKIASAGEKCCGMAIIAAEDSCCNMSIYDSRSSICCKSRQGSFLKTKSRLLYKLFFLIF